MQCDDHGQRCFECEPTPVGAHLDIRQWLDLNNMANGTNANDKGPLPCLGSLSLVAGSLPVLLLIIMKRISALATIRARLTVTV